MCLREEQAPKMLKQALSADFKSNITLTVVLMGDPVFTQDTYLLHQSNMFV